MSTDPDAARLLATYLRDHHAGSTAGLNLIRRCRRSNAGTELEATLAAIEGEIVVERTALTTMMTGLGVAPSRVKSAMGALAELVARVKSNGRVVHYSPSSRVVELESLAAAIDMKRSMWRSLRGIASDHPALDRAALDALIEAATSQRARVRDQHAEAAAAAFAASRDS